MDEAALLAAYRATTWRVRLPGGTVAVRLDPVRPVPQPLREAAIVTAWNPASVLLERRENRARNRELQRALRASGNRFFAAAALGAGRNAAPWREPGFAVLGLARAELVRLGVRFGQNAIVWIDAEGRPSLVVTREGFAGRTLGETL